MTEEIRTKAQVPTFLIKLLRMLEDKQCSDYIRWIETYDGFQITNIHKFTDQVLPGYFKHKNFSSFVRQLNMYGFTKARGIQCQNVYQNPNFRKGSRMSLRKIERKNINSQQKTIARTRSQKHKGEQKLQQTKLSQIQFKHESLQERLKQALTSNRQVFSKNTKILKEIDSKNPHQQQLIHNLFQIFAIESQKKGKGTKMGQSQQIKYCFNPNFSFQSSGHQSATKNQTNLESEYLNLNQFQQFQQFNSEQLEFEKI